MATVIGSYVLDKSKQPITHTSPPAATERIDAGPLSSDAHKIEDGPPKDYPKHVRGDDAVPNRTERRAAT